MTSPDTIVGERNGTALVAAMLRRLLDMKLPAVYTAAALGTIADQLDKAVVAYDEALIAAQECRRLLPGLRELREGGPRAAWGRCMSPSACRCVNNEAAYKACKNWVGPADTVASADATPQIHNHFHVPAGATVRCVGKLVSIEPVKATA